MGGFLLPFWCYYEDKSIPGDMVHDAHKISYWAVVSELEHKVWRSFLVVEGLARSVHGLRVILFLVILFTPFQD